MTEPPHKSTSETFDHDPPKRSSGRRVAISDEVLNLLRSEAERTAIGAMRLLRGVSDRPPGLSVQVIDSWLYGTAKTAIPAHVAYVLDRWAALPTNRLIPFTPDMSAALAAEISRTGMGSILFKRADDIPQGLTWKTIMTWFNQTTRSVSETYWQYIMARLRTLPDLSSPISSYRVKRRARLYALSNSSFPASAPPPRVARAERLAIGESDLAEMRRHRERTGIGGTVLLRTVTDKPAGLTPAMISNWLNGIAKTANPEFVAYVLARYRAWP